MPTMPPDRLAARIERDVDTLVRYASHGENMDAILTFVRTGPEQGRFFGMTFIPVGKQPWSAEMFLGTDSTHPKAEVIGEDDHWLKASGATMQLAVTRLAERLSGVIPKAAGV